MQGSLDRWFSFGMPAFLKGNTLFEGEAYIHCGAWQNSGVVAERRGGRVVCVCVSGVHETCPALRSLW